jgi:prepilin-type N-terminal cleavage/methylation domain-containing protein
MKGFTLIELLVSIFIASLVITIATSAFLTITKSAHTYSNYNKIHSQLRRSFDYLERDIHSTKIIHNCNTNTHISLIVEKEPTPINVIYFFHDNKLHKVIGTIHRPIAYNISSVAFVPLDRHGSYTTNLTEATSVSISMTATNFSRYGTIYDSLNTKIWKRNE